MEEHQESHNALIKEVAILRKENAEMKALLLEHGLSYGPDDKGKKGSIVSLYSPITFPTSNLGIDQRVALFRSLFRGREDVFARRWYGRINILGYPSEEDNKYLCKFNFIMFFYYVVT